ncbi:cleft lip and palate transmembrane protein 1 (clptm1) protein [Toxoplasma gondii TgCatPRC2]|uniref:Cleft lip and palate transmembrane protein 1 (Clptm1) protein n=1 Tax=Toxoplasma gondii TgCatPRC2 TaxID=1130821 RepID=A0A151HD70_TOXGO|nr:cleft lip and palate transmembrane protein 1 (clptm1) protein [Toxoplasma gondii TgCatPRC2]
MTSSSSSSSSSGGCIDTTSSARTRRLHVRKNWKSKRRSEPKALRKRRAQILSRSFSPTRLGVHRRHCATSGEFRSLLDSAENAASREFAVAPEGAFSRFLAFCFCLDFSLFRSSTKEAREASCLGERGLASRRQTKELWRGESRSSDVDAPSHSLKTEVSSVHWGTSFSSPRRLPAVSVIGISSEKASKHAPGSLSPLWQTVNSRELFSMFASFLSSPKADSACAVLSPAWAEGVLSLS